MSKPRVSAMILAAGTDDRMRSSRPKALHLLCGRPMVQYVIDALDPHLVDRIVIVVGDGADLVAKKLGESVGDPRILVVEQSDLRGTADAARIGLEALSDPGSLDDDEDDVIVLSGDTPLVDADLVAELLAAHRASAAAGTVLAVAPDVDGAGAVLVPGRDDTVERIGLDDVDDIDAALAGPLRADGGIYCFRRSLLAPALRRIPPDPRTGRSALSAVAAVLAATGNRVRPFDAPAATVLSHVTDRAQLAEVERSIRRRTNLAWMRAGVTMLDPDRTYVDVTVVLANDVTLFPGTVLQGETVVGPGAEIGPDTRLVDCAVGARSVVEKTMARDAEIGEDARVGPFAVLEPGSRVPAASRTGPFFHATNDEPRPEGN